MEFTQQHHPAREYNLQSHPTRGYCRAQLETPLDCVAQLVALPVQGAQPAIPPPHSMDSSPAQLDT